MLKLRHIVKTPQYYKPQISKNRAYKLRVLQVFSEKYAALLQYLGIL